MLVKKIILVLSFSLIPILSFSQENKELHIKTMHGVNLNYKHTSGNRSTPNIGNTVFITQIGVDNYTNATITSANATQTSIQLGSSNRSTSHLNTKNLNH